MVARLKDRRFWVSATLAGLLALGLAARLIHLDQPIVENYVGRQIPTAMVARNLDRGSGFLRPALDVAPFPNLFLVEPPIYASAVVGWKRLTGMALEPSGRVVSAIGILLGAWGLFRLVERREGPKIGLAAVAIFLAFPVTLRYGRAFQPDALMLGCVILGMAAWDRFESVGRWGWLVLGFVALSVGLALKVISAYVLIPLLFGVIWDKRALLGDRDRFLGATGSPEPVRAEHGQTGTGSGNPWHPGIGHAGSGSGESLAPESTRSNGHEVPSNDSEVRSARGVKGRSWELALAAATLLPALLWYAHAAHLVATGHGSRASADNSAVWLRVLIPSTLFTLGTLNNLVHFFLLRAFTPLAVILAGVGLAKWPGDGMRLWRLWGLSAFATMLLLSAKLHHEYYWLALAPVIAVGVARCLVRLAERGWPVLVVCLGEVLLAQAAAFAVSSYRTPDSWQYLQQAAPELQKLPADALIVAPEALLYMADRKGCRLEVSDAAARRAAGEWGDPREAAGVDSAIALVDFYRRHGATHFADVYADSNSRLPFNPRRLTLQAAILNRYKILVKRRDELLLADLSVLTGSDAPTLQKGDPNATDPDPR